MLADQLWCENCNRNIDHAATNLKLRSRVMVAVAFAAAGIGIYIYLLLDRVARPLGVFWFIFFGALAISIAFVSWREYGRVQEKSVVPPQTGQLEPSSVAVESRLRQLRPRPRISAFIVLSFAWIVMAAPLIVARGLKDRLIAATLLALPIGITYLWKQEQLIVRDFAVAPGSVTALDSRRRKYPRAHYEFRALGGRLIRGDAEHKGGYFVGMTLAVLYQQSDPQHNSAANDLLFYRMVAES